jgi:hypothetical protein
MCGWGGGGHGSAGNRVFGPKVYVRSPRSSDPVTERFTACRPERRFRLRVENGPGQTRPVTGASIVLNGVEVLKPSDFSRTAERLERAVPLASRNTLGLRLSGDAGAALSLAIVADVPCAAVRFASPRPGASVPAGELAVTGTLGGLPDAGVTVNGMPGFVEGAAFAAMVPVTPEVTALVATATRPDGTTVQVRQPLRVTAAAASALDLRARRHGGLPPVATGFYLMSAVAIARVTLDPANGDPPFEGTGADRLETQTFVYTRPGVYTPAVRVTDPRGGVHTGSTVVHAYDRARLEARLQAIWQPFRDALRAGDATRAVSLAHRSIRERYARIFGQPGPAGMAVRDRHLAGITLVEVGFGGAEAGMLREEDGQTFSFGILFEYDVDGVWRPSRF